MVSTVRWAVVGDYGIVVFDGMPNDPDFDAWRHAWAEAAPRLRGLLVYGRGGGPTTSQRSRIIETVHERKIDHRAAIVSDTAPVRAAVTGVNWLLPPDNWKAAAFPTSQLADAFEHLDLSRADRQRVETTLAELLGGVGARPSAK